MDRREHLPVEGEAQRHQNKAQRAACDQRGRNRRSDPGIILSAEITRRHHRAGDVAAEGKGDEDQRDLIAVAHGGQRLLADKFPGDEAVGDVVQLLEDDAAKQRHAEAPEYGSRLSHGQIPVHIDSLFF